MSDTPMVDSDDRNYPSPEYAQRIRFEGSECVVMCPEEYESLYEKARQIERKLNSAQSENTRLRAALAASKSPCVYCSLPADEWSKCKQGFPGCGRIDDAMSCPELGASMALEELKERANTLVAAGDAIDPRGDGDCDCIPGDIRLCKHCHEASVNWRKAKAAFTNPI